MRLAPLSLFLAIFGCAVLCAADLGHSAVAALTHVGFAAGAYGTYAHGTIVPTLLAALALGAIALLNMLGEALARSARVRGDWLADVAGRISTVSPLKVAPAVFAAQLLVLFAMESVEQIARFGHPLGFIASLGAPLVLVLGLHALAALIVVCAIWFACRGLTAGVRALVDAMAPAMRRLSIEPSATPNVCRLACEASAQTHRLRPLAQRIANRPPPLQASAA